MGAPAREWDNNDDDITPVSRVDVVVKNGDNAENASTPWYDDVPIVAFDGEKEGNATTGAAARLSHAKGAKLASKLR